MGWHDNTIDSDLLKTVSSITEASKINEADKFEGSDVDKSIKAKIKKIAKMTDDNDHTGALLAAVKMLAGQADNKGKVFYRTMLSKLEAVQKDQDERGDLSTQNSKIREKMRKHIMIQAKKDLPDALFNALHDAF